MMEESDDKMSVDSIDSGQSGSVAKLKPKKRSLIERELETNLTTRVTSPVVCASNASRYGRARRLKTDSDFCDTDKAVANVLKCPRPEKSPVKSPPVYRMHAINSPVQNTQNPKGSKLSNQIDNIYNVNVSLSRLSSEEKKISSPVKKFPKVYSRQDLLQTKEKEKEETMALIKNMFSPSKSTSKPSNNRVDIILDRSNEKYTLKSNSVTQNRHLDTSSVVKTLDFDSSKKKKSKNSTDNKILSKNELFELEAKCQFQVGDMAWARIGTFPFWPCIVTREPGSEMFVKKKLFGLKERDVIHVTFLGDNGRRSWVLDKLLRPFLGRQEFENARNQFTPEAKKKDPRLYAAFFISDKKQSLWNSSVLEAENLMKEPKRLRIDIFYENLEQSRMLRIVPKGQKKLVRADSDVSLSESLFDSLFSEEDGKGEDVDKYRTKRNNSLDVSEVVTACLDNMAAKSGMANIQKQSHMDRWLQKAKSNTPEKTTFKVTISVESVDDIKENKVKESKKDSKKKNNFAPRESPVQKTYKLRKSVVESQNQNKPVSMNEKVESNFVKEKEERQDMNNEIIKNGLVTNSVVFECASEKTKDLENDNITIVEKDKSDLENCNSNLGQNVANSTKNCAFEINLICEEIYTKDKKHENKINVLEINCDEKISTTQEDATNHTCKTDDAINIKENNYNKTKKQNLINDINIVDPDCKSDEKVDMKEHTKDNIQNQRSLNHNSEFEMFAKNSVNHSSTPVKEVCLQEKTLCSSPGIKNESDLTYHENLLDVKLKSTPEKVPDLDISKDSDLTDCESLFEDKEKFNSAKNKLDISKHSDDNELTDCEHLLDIEEKIKKQSLLDKLEVSNLTECEKLLNSESKPAPGKELEHAISNNKQLNKIEHLSACESKVITKIKSHSKKSFDGSKDSEPGKNIKKVEIKKNLERKPTVSTLSTNHIEHISTDKTSKTDSINNSNKDHANKNEVPQIKAKDYIYTIDSTVGLKSDELVRKLPALEKNAQEIVKLLSEASKIQENVNISKCTTENGCKFLNGTIENKIDFIDPHEEQKLENLNSIRTEDDISIESLSDDDFDKVSINSAISEISITENEKLAFTKGVPEALINGFHCDISIVKDEPQDTDAVSMNSESDNITLKDLKLRIKGKAATNSESNLTDVVTEHNIPEKDIKSENNYIEKVDTQRKENCEVVPKVGKVLLHRIDVDKYLNVPLNIRKSKRLSRLRDNMKKDTREEKHDTESELCTSEKSVESHNIPDLNDRLTKPKETEDKSKEMLNKSKEILKLDKDFSSNNNVSRDKKIKKEKEPPKIENENIAKGEEQKNNISDNTGDTLLSVNSNNSNIFSKKQKQQSKNKPVMKEDSMKEPEFQLYLEIKQDRIIDEHPELTYNEIVAYLYKTWLFEQSLKTDIKKIDDKVSTDLIKTENSIVNVEKDTVSTKKSKRNRKEKISSGKEFKKITDYMDVSPRDKPKRKVSQPYYNEDYSDIEDEIKMFEIFRKTPNDKKSVASKMEIPKAEPASEVILQKENQACNEINGKGDPNTSTPEIVKEKIKVNNEVKENEPISSTSEKDDAKVQIETSLVETKEDLNQQTETSLEEYYDVEELYFEQLTQPKPNVFKGLVREKVCEICEKKSNLVKCKGCNGMFHVDCVKKENEVTEIGLRYRGRKKRKKPRGRKPKSSADSTLESESHSDDRSQDLNASGELNEPLNDFESRTIADAENFEAQLEAKMKELIEDADKIIQYDSYSSDDGLDWSDTEAGKCKIVDIKIKEKRVEPIDMSNFKCNNCQKYDTPICFVCKSAISPKNKSEIRQRCQISHCHKYYHLECLDHWPQTQFNGGESSKQDNKMTEAITCPRHVCHTCVCDDPRGCKTRFSGDKLARCVRCPATYHTFTKCLPAGTEILTASHIICPRHYENKPGKIPYHVNTGWCFICALGGSLICCEYCPTSLHAECLNMSPPEGGYMCEDCETGRLPLYGEMVWVKLGHYRWWPGIILHPSEIPSNIMAVKHSLGEFVVRFFGQYDHYWVNRGRVFPFQEGDTGRISSQKSKIDEAFTKAMEHANRAFEILKNIEPNEEENLDIASSLLPPQYVKLKVNKPCGSLCGKRIEIEESSLTQCDCNPDEQDPCGPDSHCLNRMLLTECGPTCRAGERCQNRAFERRQYPALVPYRTPHRGWGLKTLEDIKAGQFVIEYVGELIDMEEFQRRMRRKHEMRDENFYFLTLDKERMIDAGPKGNLARFMNHCCEPNCETQKWTVLGDVRVGLFAINDIPANSEVTFNYNLECAGIDKKRCMCGAKRCSGYIGAKPKPDTKDESQLKKPRLAAKRTYKKRKNAEESPSTSKTKVKRPVGRPAKPRELTEIEKDLLIIKSATNAQSSDSEGSGRLSSVDVNVNLNEKVSEPEKKPLKRKRVSFSTEDKLIVFDNTSSPSVKKIKLDEVKEVKEENDINETASVVGD